MEAHICNHPKVPHTVTWMGDDDGSSPAPFSRTFDDLEDADIFSQKIIRSNTERISWLKISRADNETFVCYTWTNSKEKKASEESVKLQIDMEPFKDVFDNISLGFQNHGKAIRRLRVSQTIVTLALILHMVAEWVL